MRIVFLEVDTERAWAVASIGPAFIGAFLRAQGHEVGFVRAHLDAADADVVPASPPRGRICSASR